MVYLVLWLLATGSRGEGLFATPFLKADCGPRIRTERHSHRWRYYNEPCQQHSGYGAPEEHADGRLSNIRLLRTAVRLDYI